MLCKKNTKHFKNNEQGQKDSTVGIWLAMHTADLASICSTLYDPLNSRVIHEHKWSKTCASLVIFLHNHYIKL